MTPITITTTGGGNPAATVKISEDEITILAVALQAYLPHLEETVKENARRFAGVPSLAIAAAETVSIATALLSQLDRLSLELVED